MSTDPRIEFLSELYEALTDRPRDVVDLRRSLEERSIDVDGTLGRARSLIGSHRKRGRLREAQERLQRVQNAVERWAAEGKQSVGAIRDELARALAGEAGSTAYQAYHRKLEEVSEEDLESLGEDAELLEFIERMEAGDSE